MREQGAAGDVTGAEPPSTRDERSEGLRRRLPEAEAGFEEPDAEREGPGDSSKEYHFYFQKKLYLQCFGNKQMIG